MGRTKLLQSREFQDGYASAKRRIVQSITPNIIMYLPKNVDLAQLEELASLSSPPLTLEKNDFDGKRELFN
ncbi:hypothetical protein Bca101_075848 [Brassica carinata]